MEVQYSTKLVRRLTTKELNEIKPLRLSNGVGFQILERTMAKGTLRTAEDAFLVIARHDTVMVGWAMFRYDFGDIMLFVEPTLRRRGIGTQLISRAKARSKAKINFHAHNHVSTTFFTNVQHADGDDVWLTDASRVFCS